MDSSNLNDLTHLLELPFPFDDFPYEDAPESSGASTAPATFPSSIGGQYQLYGASFFDTEYIDPDMLSSEFNKPAMLMGFDVTLMGSFLNYYTSMQYTQYQPSPFNLEWESPAIDFEHQHQQQIIQAQQGVISLEFVFPNVLNTSDDWQGNQRGVHGPIDRATVRQGGHFEAFGEIQVPHDEATMRCDWPSCKRKSFSTQDHFAQHLHGHRDEVSDNFVAPGVCQWPGCRSRKSGATFQTKANFVRHLKLHMKYHWCNVPGCKHGEGFARQPDLKRHLKTHSKECAFKCPESNCASSSLGFPRKDKLDAHIKSRHPHLMGDIQSRRCTVRGCTVKNPFESMEDLQTHFAATHRESRPYLCPVENCPRHKNGFPTLAKLDEHSVTEHDAPKCIYDHCNFRSLDIIKFKHIERNHDCGLECRLPGCEGSESRFTYDRFARHLTKQHDFKKVAYFVLLAAMRGDMSKFPEGTFVKCKYCSEHRV